MRKTFCEGDSIITGADKKSARGYALESEWKERGDKLYYPDCYEFMLSYSIFASKIRLFLKKKGK
jgi:hypothetical protein